MNPLLSRLQPYPFERLRQLFAGVTPNPQYKEIKLSIGEPQHETPAFIKETLAACQLKMPQLAVPVRVIVCGRAQTPSLDAVLEHFDQKKVLERLQGV